MLVLLAALVAPYFVDWTAYRADFEREASNILGRKVIVKGSASARLLPFPSVTFNEVEVEDEDGSSLMTIDRFRMDAELAPYLSGEIYIYSMTLERPKVRLPLRADDSVGWVVGDPKIPSGARVVLQNVAVNDGMVVIEDEARGRTKTLLDIDATLSAGSLAGPVAGSGSFTVDGDPVTFSLSTGVPLDDGAMPVRLTASNQTLDAEIVLDGRATASGGVPQFSGSASLVRPAPRPVDATSTASPFETLDAANEAAAPAGDDTAPAPLRATGVVTLTTETAMVKELRVEAGGGTQPYVLTGTGSLDYGDETRFDVALEGEQVNVDALGGNAGDDGPSSPAQTSGEEAPAEAPQQGLARRLEAMRAVLSEVPRPSIDGKVEISLPVVTAGDTTIRDVAFVAAPRPAGWRLDSFAAEVPGRTRVEASGDLGIDEGFSFEGDLLVASQQPSGFSDWLSGHVDPAVRALSRAGFSARTTLTANRQIFDGLEVDVGGNAITGRIAREETGGVTTMTADLTGGSVDLDAVLALSRLFTGRQQSLIDADRFDVALKAGPITYGGADADAVDADLSFDGDSLKVDHLHVDGLAGARITSSGSLTDLSGGDATGKLDVELESAEPQRFFAFLQRVSPGIPLIEVLAPRAARLAPLKLSGVVEATEGAPGKKPTLIVRLDGTADGTKIDVETAVENGIYAAVESGRFGLDLRLENDRPKILLGQLGITAAEIDPPAPLEVELSVSAAETGPAVTSATIRAPGSEVSLDGTVDVAPVGITGADLAFYLNSDDLAPWMRTLAVDLGQSFDAVPVELNAGFAFGQGAWQVAGLNGRIAGVEVSGDLVQPAGKPLGGKLSLSRLSLPWLGNLVYGRSPLGPAGEYAWSSDAFTPSLLPQVDAAVELSAGRVQLGNGLDLANVTADLELSPNAAALMNLRAAFAGAETTGSLVMRNSEGVAGFSLVAYADGIDLSGLAPALSGSEGPARLDGEIRLDSSGQSYQALISALTGAGDLTVTNATLPGVPEAIMQPLLAASSTANFSPQGDAAATFRSLSQGRSFDIATLTSEFAVTAGDLELSPVELAGKDSRLAIDASLDLASLELGGDLTLSLDPGLDRVEGAQPQVTYALRGTLTAPGFDLDATALTNYLQVLALEREQARVEAMQEGLEEKLRLRREARFYQWRKTRAENRAAEAEARRAAEEEAERAARQEEARRRTAEEQAAREAAARKATAAEARAPAAAPAARSGDNGRNVPPALIFDRPLPNAANGAKPGFQSLPGVTNPLDF